MQRIVYCALFLLVSTSCLLADFSYQETTQITGGSLMAMMKMAGPFARQAREPIVSTVALKGNRMVHVRAETTEIIDLDKETITNINLKNKTYSVMTFAQMKEMLNDMAQRMREKPEGDVKFDVSSKETGQSNTFAGLKAKELVLTMTMQTTDAQSGTQGNMVVTSDMWLAREAPGYEQVRKFHIRMAEKLGLDLGQGFNPMMGMRMAKSMAEVSKEMAKLDGIPVHQVMSIQGETPGNPGAGAGGTTTNSSNSGDSTDSGRPKMGGLAGLAVGGLGGFGRRKKQDNTDNAPGSQAPAQQSSTAPGVLMESTTDLSSFSSSAVDDAKFDVPAGFKQVEPESMRRRR